MLRLFCQWVREDRRRRSPAKASFLSPPSFDFHFTLFVFVFASLSSSLTRPGPKPLSSSSVYCSSLQFRKFHGISQQGVDDHNTETETAHLKAGDCVEIYVMPLLSIPLERWKHPIGHRLPEIAYLQRASKVGT